MSQKDPSTDDQFFWTLPKQNKTQNSRNAMLVFLVVGVLSVILFIYQQSEPAQLPAQGVTLEVHKGMSVQSIAQSAQTSGLVRSEFFLYLLLRHRYDASKIYAGIYRFDTPMNVFDVAKKLASSDIDKTLLSVTVPEGSTRKDIADIIKQKLPYFDTTDFLNKTKDSEGYLFPDTYLVRTDFSADEFVSLLKDTYEKKIAPLRPEIASSGLSEYQVLTLASILEREANDEISMRTVSGILQKRLTLKMPLQTDATMEYVLNKSLSALTADDLKTDSPYNTYKYAGLPPTPIGNPGLQSIKAVLEPIETKYLYYLTDSEGIFHYSTTFEAHKLNIQKYLK